MDPDETDHRLTLERHPASLATTLEVAIPRAALPEINGLRAGCAPPSLGYDPGLMNLSQIPTMLGIEQPVAAETQ